MTVNVVRNSPPPAARPPDTYDILGLSFEQAALIRDLLGAVSSGSDPDTHPVYVALYDRLPGYGLNYEFVSGSDVNSYPVRSLTPHPLG